ncbi:MAG: response regulator [Candidatus Acidiferrales bacterium]
MSQVMDNTAPAAVKPLRLLIADDDPDDLELCLRTLRKSGIPFEAHTATTREEFTKILRENPVDMVLSDFRMKNWTGIDAFHEIREVSPETPMILLTGTLGDEKAVECIKLGITDYVLKEQIARLPMSIRRAEDEKALRHAEVHALNALRESEERYRTLVESAPEAIVVFDPEKRRFMDCNDRAMRLLRMTREELLRRGFSDISAEVQPDGIDHAWREREDIQAALQQTIPSREWILRSSDGEEFPAEVYFASLPSPGNHLIRASILDITERKRAESALRESEARYRGLIDNATYGIYWISLTGEFINANPAFARMLGYDSQRELLALGTTEPIFRDPLVRKQVLKQYASSGNVDAQVEWKCKDGSVITVRLKGHRIRNPNASDYMEVFVEDITERLTLEKQLVQAQKFEAIGQLAGGIAHDFNNMIGAILGWTEMGIDETPADSRLHRHFEKILQQSHRAAALTRQLLAFARRQILEPRNMDLNQTVKETLSLLEKVLGSHIEIKTHLDEQLSNVRADPTQVDQVLMNLCINARDAMPQGGSLIIETQNVEFDEEYCFSQPYARPGHFVMLAVSDTGTGMDAATIDRIFEPFFTTKELGKGTGLGLATVYGIVRQHGGFVHVYSEINVGSTFRIYLPVSREAADLLSPVVEAGSIRGGSETILVAEDHEGLGELARETLEGMGYQVVMARDGEQAVTEFLAHKDSIDLLLFDVVLPKLGGPEAHSRISAVSPGIPVLFVTGYSSDVALRNRVQQEGLPVLQKPYSPRDLARRVRETLDKRTQS